MNSTDFLGLGEHKIIKETCENLPKNLQKTLNILTVKDSVLFTWDFQNYCVLSLNLKAQAALEDDKVIHQKLLPLYPPLFTPENLLVNESGNLLAISGPEGVLVLELPARYPPYGAFDNNKELVYCRSHSLDERLLFCNELVKVRQVRFHPGSINDCHILILTSDNTLRLYQISNNEATNLYNYSIGERPVGVFPGSKTTFLDLYGEIAVDFDFGLPEYEEEKIHNKTLPKDFIEMNMIKSYDSIKKDNSLSKSIVVKSANETLNTSNQNNNEKWNNLIWPIYILRGDGSIYFIKINLNKLSKKLSLKGPLPISNPINSYGDSEASSLICLDTSPATFAVAMANGILNHFILLDIENDNASEISNIDSFSKNLFLIESVEIQLSFSVKDECLDNKNKSSIYLFKDDTKHERYFAVHNGGVHSVDVNCLEMLQNFAKDPNEENTTDLLSTPSTVEYLLCTKSDISEHVNRVFGFSLYYNPTSIIAILNDGNLVSLELPSVLIANQSLNLTEKTDLNKNPLASSPLKKMMKEPFDHYIQKILSKSGTQPILKLGLTGNLSSEQYFELVQKTVQSFREDYFQQHSKARQEISKRNHALQMLKTNQLKEVGNINAQKKELQKKAEQLAEKYEDIKDKQDELSKKCENLLMLVSRKRSKASDAEKDFLKDLNKANVKANNYMHIVDKLKAKLKYQEVQMANWKLQEAKTQNKMNEIQSATVQNSLKETSMKIKNMIEDINKVKKQLK